MFINLWHIFKRLVSWLDFGLSTAVAYSLSWLPDRLTKDWYPNLFRFWCWSFIRALGVDLKCHQKYLGRLPSQFILIANHPSAFEDIGMPALFQARFLAKYEVQHWWVFGRISRSARTLYVKREDKTSRKAAAQELESLVRAGESVALYPEGGCKGRRIHQPFQYGCFDVALKTGVPILPVFIHYEAQADFEWAGETLVQKIITLAKASNKTANYYVFDPIDPKKFGTKEELTAYVEQIYLKWQDKYLL